MKLGEGRVGFQEAASLAAIGCISCGIFGMNTGRFYESGNASYLSSAVAALISLACALLVAAAMKRTGSATLAELYKCAFGSVLALVFGFVTILSLVYAAALPLIRLVMILCRYVFVAGSEQSVALYALICLVTLTLFGFETLARTARLFAAVIVLSFAVTMLIAIPAYEAYRLYPLLGVGFGETMRQSLCGVARFLPPLLALLVCGRGVHGASCAARSARSGLLTGGVVTSAVQLCLGMTYPYTMLSRMHSPMYRMTMAVRTSNSYLRTDKLLLFFWVIGGMLAGAFLSYACALFYAGLTRIRDFRPAALCFSCAVASLALVGNLDIDLFEGAMSFLWDWAWAFVLVPPLLASVLAPVRSGRRA